LLTNKLGRRDESFCPRAAGIDHVVGTAINYWQSPLSVHTMPHGPSVLRCPGGDPVGYRLNLSRTQATRRAAVSRHKVAGLTDRGRRRGVPAVHCPCVHHRREDSRHARAATDHGWLDVLCLETSTDLLIEVAKGETVGHDGDSVRPHSGINDATLTAVTRTSTGFSISTAVHAAFLAEPEAALTFLVDREGTRQSGVKRPARVVACVGEIDAGDAGGEGERGIVASLAPLLEEGLDRGKRAGDGDVGTAIANAASAAATRAGGAAGSCATGSCATAP